MAFFEMFLNGALSWGIGKSLDVMTKCFTCDQENISKIRNVHYNHLECSNCHIEHEQFTNACKFTFNKYNKQIGHVQLSGTPTGFIPSYEDFLFFKGNLQGLTLPIRMMTSGLEDKAFIVKCEVSKFNGYKDFVISEVVHPSSSRHICDIGLNIHPLDMFNVLGGRLDEKEAYLLPGLSQSPTHYEKYVSEKVVAAPIEVKICAIAKDRSVLYEDNFIVAIGKCEIEKFNLMNFSKK